MNVIIAEDEKLAAERLEQLAIRCDPSITITARYDSVEELVEYFSHNSIDLLFLDIQLADGKSFEVFKKVDVKAPIIFTTAYDQYALQAFKVHSIDYLLKPIPQEELQFALNKLKTFTPANTLDHEKWEVLKELAKVPIKSYKQRFIVKFGNKLLYKPAQHIAYFFADGKNAYLVTREENRKFLIDHTLEELAGLLDPKEFYRISRKVIIQIHAIAELKGSISSGIEVLLVQKTEFSLLISRDKVNDFKKWLDN